MTVIAFYAPMKPPDDPVPSGDRTMARALLAALEGAGLGDVRLASRLRSRDGVGDPAAQDRIFAGGGSARSSGFRPDRGRDLWLTYHSYYKAPDLLGPRLSRRWGIPYVVGRGNPRVEAPARPLRPVRQSSGSRLRCGRRHLLPDRVRPRSARARSRPRPAARQAAGPSSPPSRCLPANRIRHPTRFGYLPVRCSAQGISWRATRRWRRRWLLCNRRPGRSESSAMGRRGRRWRRCFRGLRTR